MKENKKLNYYRSLSPSEKIQFIMSETKASLVWQYKWWNDWLACQYEFESYLTVNTHD